MADTYTTNLNLTKPEVGASTDTWGTKLNADLDTLDAIFSASGTAINLGNVTVASLTTTGDINFGDNDKAIFGAGSDLQIYHDGSNSRIQEAGTGSLLVRGTNLQLQDSDGYDYLTCTDGGNGGTVALKHLGTTVLNTTTDGITVTGTVNSMTIAASGFTCPTNQNFIINSPNGLRMNIDSNNTGTAENFTIGHNEASTGSNILFRINETGNASIGHGNSNAKLHIGDANATGNTTNPALQIGGSSTYRLGMYTSTEGAVIENKNGDDGIQFRVKTAGEAMRIDGGTGNVAIGSTSSRSFRLYLENSGSSGAGQLMLVDSDNSGLQREIRTDAGVLSFDYWDGSNRSNHLTIAANGNVGIGNDNPTSAKLEVKGAKTQSGGAPIGNVLIADSTSLAANTGGGITFQGVYQTGGAITGFASIEAMKETATHNEYGGALVLKTRQNQGSMNEHMRITSTGNVGINTTAPTCSLSLGEAGGEKLHIYGGATVKAGFGVDMSGSSRELSMFHSTSGTDGNISFGKRLESNGTYTEAMRISGSGVISADGVYSNTTSDAANVRVLSNGNIIRSTSSKKYKNSITDASKGLKELNNLRPVTYKGNEDGDTVFYGLIAEEVHDAGLNEFVEYNDDNEPDALRYPHMVSLCIKAIQEQQAIIDDLKSRIETLEG